MPSGISYLDAVWPLVTGCSKASTGCESCYAARLAATRLKHLPAYQGLAYKDKHGRFQWTGEVRCHEDKLEVPLHWRSPRIVGVAFMGDLFHQDVSTEFIAQVFTIMARCHQHRFLLLTKRPDRAAMILQGRYWGLPPPTNIWMGVTAENQEEADYRLPILANMKVAKRWVSIEPMLGPVDLGRWVDSLNLIVVGCESGPNARPMELDWVRSLHDQAVAAGGAFYMKQSMENGKLIHAPFLDGHRWLEVPE